MFDDIKVFFKENNIPEFRFKQIESAVYKQNKVNFNDITMIPKDLREKLNQNFSLLPLKFIKKHKTEDSIKFLLETEDKHLIEVILMLHKDKRYTVCVSSQIFCALKCKFCATGANKFKRSLTHKEIVSQVLFVNNYLREEKKKVTNVVFMGMGEPFLNYENVIKSSEVLNEKLEIGARHITVSTAGIVPQIKQFAIFPKQIRLAVSLHAPNDKLRDELMPINKKYPLKELFKALDEFVKITNKRVSYEYVLIKDVNDSVKCAQQLSELLKKRLSHLNLLIFNEHEFVDFKKPEYNRVRKFKSILEEYGIEVSIRKSMGDDISGACGQLAGKK